MLLFPIIALEMISLCFGKSSILLWPVMLTTTAWRNLQWRKRNFKRSQNIYIISCVFISFICSLSRSSTRFLSTLSSGTSLTRTPQYLSWHLHVIKTVLHQSKNCINKCKITLLYCWVRIQFFITIKEKVFNKLLKTKDVSPLSPPVTHNPLPHPQNI